MNLCPKLKISLGLMHVSALYAIRKLENAIFCKLRTHLEDNMHFRDKYQTAENELLHKNIL